jgi:predicted permease
MGVFARDLRHGIRQLIRQPGFSLAAIGSLALGIGLTTTLFSVVNAVLLRATPVARPDRLVEIYSGSTDYPQLTSSYPDYQSIRASVEALEAVAAHSYVRAILATRDRPRLVTGESVSGNYFDVLGLRPPLGRGFRADEAQAPGSSPVLVLSHGLWQRQFGGRPNVLGETLELSGRKYVIVGVAPRAFRGTLPGVPTDFWAPLTMIEQFEFSGVQWTADNDPDRTRLTQRGTRWLFLKGRLAEGRTIEQARSQIEALFTRLRAEHPNTHKNVRPDVVAATSVRFHPMLDRYVKAASAVLLTAVGLVLLIACANVANMLLARSTARRRELAIRTAIGAGRGRVARQLLTEGLVLAGAGGAVGTLIAVWAGRAVSGFGTSVFPMPIDFNVSLDATVLMFAIGVSLLTALVFGLAPAWSASKLDLVSALKESSGDGGARRRVTLRDALVVGQLALSLVLLVAGALLTRGLLAARATDIGYDPGPISSLSFNLQMNGYDHDQAGIFRDRALAAVRALPGVLAVSHASRLPLAPDINMEGVKVPGHHGPADDATPIDAVRVGTDYFRVVGVPIVAGRAFTLDDIEQDRRVVIVNETMARRYWPKGSALGRRIHLGDFDQPAHEVVGVTGDHRVRSVGEEPRPYVHLPASPTYGIGLVVRTSMPATSALPMLRQALWTLEPDIVFTEDAPAAEIVAATMAPTRIGAAVLGSFGALALLLAAVGLYGVIAYSVSLRTREVGIRIALGAARGQVLRLVLAQGGRLALIGLVLGTLASLGAGRVLASLLYGVSPFDPAAYAVAAALLAIVAVAANLAPALAAARIDPLRALRRE